MMYSTYIKRIATTLLIAVTGIVNAQVGVGTTAPEGMLDTQNALSYGIVFPKAALTSTIIEAPVTNPNGGGLVAGTTIYNTNTTITGSNDVNPGIYAWDGSQWIPQYLREDAAIFVQTPINQRVITGSTAVNSSGSDWADVNNLGAGSSFTAKFSGQYRVKANFNFGAGRPELPPSPDIIKMPTQEGYFRFTFDGTPYLIYTHAYSIYNDDIGSGTYYEEFRHDSSLVLYENLVAGQTYNFQLEIDMFVSSEFENGGDSGDGRAHVGIIIPCTVEFTYLEE